MCGGWGDSAGAGIAKAVSGVRSLLPGRGPDGYERSQPRLLRVCFLPSNSNGLGPPGSSIGRTPARVFTWVAQRGSAVLPPLRLVSSPALFNVTLRRTTPEHFSSVAENNKGILGATLTLCSPSVYGRRRLCWCRYPSVKRHCVDLNFDVFRKSGSGKLHPYSRRSQSAELRGTVRLFHNRSSVTQKSMPMKSGLAASRMSGPK